MNLFLSDAWAAGDPMLTWGNYKIIARQPMLASMHHQWLPQNDNWGFPLCGGPKGNTYLNVGKSLIPEIIVMEGEPTGFPRAPLSKRRVYLDARNSMFPQAISYDRRGDVWKSFEPGFSSQVSMDGSMKRTAADGRTEWTWSWVISNDIQSGRVTRFHHAESCSGGWKTEIDPGIDMLNEYMTVQAMRRLGT